MLNLSAPSWLRTLWVKPVDNSAPTNPEKHFASIPTQAIPNSTEDLKRFSRPELFGHGNFDRKRR